MINVEISPFGRQLMTMVLGAIKYQALLKDKAVQIAQQEKKAIESLEKEQNMWNDISFDITSSLIDKRYKSSKEFINTGVTSGSLKYKKNISEDQLRFRYIAEQNLLKSRVKYNNTISKHNQRIADQKVKATFKLSDLKKIV